MAGGLNVGSAFSTFSIKLQGVQKSAAKATAAMGRIEKKSKTMVAAAESSSRRVSKAFKKIGTVGAGIGLVVGAGLGYAIKEFKNFESTMSGVKAVLSPTSEEFDALTKKAKSLGATTKFTSQQAASGVEILAKNGLTATEILNGAADAALALASATGSDLQIAADIATDAMGQFNFEAGELSEVINGITGVTTASKFSINDYALALAQGGGVAATVGVSFNDFNASISAMSPLFKSGSDAGTSFKVFLQRLVPASAPAQEAMQRLGLMTKEGGNEFFTAEGKMKSMSDIADILGKATKDLSDEQKNEALSTIFGTDAMRAAAGIASMTGEEFETLSKKIQSTDAAKNAAIRMDNLEGSMLLAGSAASGLAVTIGEMNEGPFRGLVDMATKLLTKFNEFAKDNPKLTQTIIMATVALAGILLVLGLIGIIIGPVVAGFAALTTTVAILSAPVWLVALAVIALVALMVILWTKSDEIAGGLKVLWEDWAERLSRLMLALGETLIWVWENFKEGMANIFTSFGEWLIDKWTSISNWLSNTMTALGETLIWTWQSIKQGISDKVANIRTAVTDGFNALISNMKTIGSNIITGLWDGLQEKIAWIKGKVQGFVDDIKEMFSGAKGFDEGSPSKVMKEIGNHVSEGLAIGITQRSGMVEDAASGVVNSTININNNNTVSDGVDANMMAERMAFQVSNTR